MEKLEQDSIATWSQGEFAHAELGDERRRARLVAIATQVAKKPAGTVTRVFDDGAAREGAFRFLESDLFSHRDIQAATRIATAKRAAHERFVYVAADLAALAITDRSRQNFGPVSVKKQATGALAMSALVISPDGIPLGLAAQEFWTRSSVRAPDYRVDQRLVTERETRFWLEVMSQTTTVLDEHAPGTLPWFQIDRAGDATHVLLQAVQLGVAFTIRASYDRRIRTARGKRYLRATLAASPLLGSYPLFICARPNRPARTALIEVRARHVTLDVAVGHRGQGRTGLALWCIEAREVNADDVEEPVLWRLFTNRTVTGLSDAIDVINGYTMRWHVENFHLAWKSGTCHIEDSRLRTLEHFAKWATILAAVAVRAERLKLLSRATPDVPAETEFSRDEIDAVIILRKPKGVELGASPTLGEVVRWIADIGGYTGKSSGGPPGIRVISRALVEVNAVAQAVARLRPAPG